MESTARVWICDQCKHVWLRGEIVPTHCAKCRSRRWNDGDEKVAGDDAAGKSQRSGRRAGLSKLREAASDQIDVHPMQPVRTELGERDGHIPSSQCEGSHRRRNVGGRIWCSDCKCYVEA